MARVRRYPSYKTFSGQRYGRNISYDTKAEAKAHAERLRKDGDRVRIAKDKLLNGKVIYVTWLRKGR